MDGEGKRVPGWLLILVVIGGAALLVPLAVNTPEKGPQPPVKPVGTPLTPGVRALLSGDYEQAKAVFEEAKARVEPGSLQARQLPLLEQIARVWSTKPFDREAAIAALRELEAATPLPAGLISWIKVQRSKRGL